MSAFSNIPKTRARIGWPQWMPDWGKDVLSGYALVYAPYTLYEKLAVKDKARFYDPARWRPATYIKRAFLAATVGNAIGAAIHFSDEWKYKDLSLTYNTYNAAQHLFYAPAEADSPISPKEKWIMATLASFFIADVFGLYARRNKRYNSEEHTETSHTQTNQIVPAPRSKLINGGKPQKSDEFPAFSR